MSSLMFSQLGTGFETFNTFITGIGSLPSVSTPMNFQCTDMSKFLTTKLASVRFDSGVSSFVRFQVVLPREPFVASFATEGFLPCIRLRRAWKQLLPL